MALKWSTFLALSIIGASTPLVITKALDYASPTKSQLVSRITCNQGETISQRVVTLSNSYGSGSGLLLDGEFVLTANHVTEGGSIMNVSGSIDEEIQAMAMVYARNTDYDLALLQLDTSYDLSPLAISPTTVYNTQAMWYSHMQGTFQDALLGPDDATKPNTQSYAQLSIPGDSGSVLISCKGNVVGVTVIRTDTNCPKKNAVTCVFKETLSVKAELINAFLKNAWPNYNAAGNFM